MRAGRAIGTALATLVAAAVSLVWLTPPAAAANGQAETKIERKVIVAKPSGAGPAVVTIQKDEDGKKTVESHLLQDAPIWTALAGGGPRLGVEIRDVTADDVTKLKLPASSGVVIEGVTKESAAEKAGVKAGDVVVQYDGEAVRSAQQFTRLVRESVPDRAVKIAVIRDGKRLELTAAPAKASESFDIQLDDKKMQDIERQLGSVGERLQRFRFDRAVPAPGPDAPGNRTFRWRQPGPLVLPEGGVMEWFDQGGGGNLFLAAGRGRLGVTVQDLTPELAAYFGVKDGLLVNSVQADSPAAKAGIKAGDVIQSVDGKAVTTANQLVRELADKKGEVTIGLTRDKKPLSLKATLEDRQPVRRRTVVGRPA